MINWNTTDTEKKIIKKIARRALRKSPALARDWDEEDIMMDITATHLNGCPLKLRELFLAADFDFMHDVCGINRHINRKTGKLDKTFLPRFAA